MASPLFAFAGGDPGEDAEVAAAGSVVATLDSLDGVQSVEWSIAGTDDLSDPSDYTLTPSGFLGSVATTTALGLGTAAVLRCRINAGVDPRTGNPSDAMTTTAVFHVLTSTGNRVKAEGEDVSATERDVIAVNTIARSTGSGSDSGVSIQARLVSTTNLDLNGAETIDGIATSSGDVVLAAGQTATDENGPYTVSHAGAWTRAPGATLAASFPGMIVSVNKGTDNADTLWQCTTDAPITLETTGLTFEQIPNKSDKRKLNELQVSVNDYGATGDGTTDDTVAIQAAIAAAGASFGGGSSSVVYFPRGRYRVTSTVTISRAITLRGGGHPAGGANGQENFGSTILHDFDGDLFVFDGGDAPLGGKYVTGGGIAGLRIAQIYGGAGDEIPRGRAIRVAGADLTHYHHWLAFRDLIIEESVNSPWTWGISMDGTLCDGISNTRITEVSMHIGPGASGGIQLLGVGACKIISCELHLIDARIEIGGTAGVPSGQIQILGGDCTDIDIDRASNVQIIGTQCSSITTTANTAAPCSLQPGALTTAFADSSGTSASGAFYYDYGLIDDPYWRSSREFLIPNAKYYSAIVAAGTSTRKVIGLDASNNCRIAPAGTSVVAIGSPGSFSSATAGDLLFAQNNGVRITNEANDAAALALDKDDSDFVRLAFSIYLAGTKVYGGGSLQIQADTTGVSLPNLTASRVVATNGSSYLTVLTYGTSAAVDSLVQLDGAGKAFVAALNVSGLTASSTVVTDASKNLASLAYDTAATASTIAKRDANGRLISAPQLAAYSDGSATFSVTGLGPVVYCYIANTNPTTITNITGASEGTVVTMVFSDANSTFDRTSAFLNGAANFVSTQYDTLTLVKGPSAWHEISRSANG
jgi:hypothetical protein